MNLKDTQVIVTGAASGLGRCFALNFAQAGASVLAFDMNEAGLQALVKEQPEIKSFVGSVTNEDHVKNAVAKCKEYFGGVNCVINNAGIFRDGLLIRQDRQTGEVSTMSLDDWQSVIDVDLTGPFLFTREVAAQMVNDKIQGVIVNISSCSRHGNRGQGNYSAAKAGLVADTKLWGEELSRYGIRVGAIAPGFVATPLLEGMRPEMLEKMISKIPLRRLAKPEEIFMAAKFIVECDYFTGRCIDVDGGIVM